MKAPITTVVTAELFTDGSSGQLCERRFQLVVVSGPDQGYQHALEAGTTMIGTHPDNDIVVHDSTVSRYHLELQVRRDGLKITDLSSTNGTVQRTPQGDTKLGSITISSPTRLRLGKYTEIDFTPVGEEVSLGAYSSDRFAGVLGVSAPMQALFAMLSRVAPTDATLLLEGETGTGKEALAEAVHQQSSRASHPFVVVDCGSIPHELIASELFGHTRGAYTGATADKIGLIEAADHGTLFLDEIGELALDLQPQLLRALEKREIRRVGQNKTIAVDIRVIAATHRDLRQMVREGTFREDLYYRLAVVRVEVPPLRERVEDIPLLATYFAHALGRNDFILSSALMEELCQHSWPGNVRELRNVVERALSLGQVTLGLSATAPAEPGFSGVPDGAGRLPSDIELLDQPFKEAKSQLIESFEREYLVHLLDKYRGNISRAASAAGIDRNYIHRLVKKYGIAVPRG